MTKYIILLLTTTVLAGCATVSMNFHSSQKNKLARAVVLLEHGKRSAAAELLTAVSTEPAVPGVTDEALFRLSLLHLASNHEKSGIPRARHYLERLKKEYPSGSWASLASILNEFLASAESAQLQNRKLKELNLSLTKENKDFRENLEKLKNLELDLERGNRR